MSDEEDLVGYEGKSAYDYEEDKEWENRAMGSLASDQKRLNAVPNAPLKYNWQPDHHSALQTMPYSLRRQIPTGLASFTYSFAACPAPLIAYKHMSATTDTPMPAYAEEKEEQTYAKALFGGGGGVGTLVRPHAMVADFLSHVKVL